VFLGAEIMANCALKNCKLIDKLIEDKIKDGIS